MPIVPLSILPVRPRSASAPFRAIPISALLLAASGFLVGAPMRVAAQAFNYPSLQLPTASTRDYTAGIAGGRGTTAFFQWRERAGEGAQFSLDAGIADPQGRSDLLLFVGVSGGKELLRATDEQPLDLMGTAGAGIAFGGGTTLLRVPVGVSIGHTFPVEGGMSVTPYVHPRISLDVCGDCTVSKGSRSSVGLDFDLGANLQVNQRFALRLAAVFSGSDQIGSGDAFTVGFNWTPSSLARAVSGSGR